MSETFIIATSVLKQANELADLAAKHIAQSQGQWRKAEIAKFRAHFNIERIEMKMPGNPSLDWKMPRPYWEVRANERELPVYSVMKVQSFLNGYLAGQRKSKKKG